MQGFVQRWKERRAMRRRIAEELRFHLEEAVAHNVARGLTEKEARAEAETRLGSSRAIVHECAGVASEDQPYDSLQVRRVRQFALLGVAAVAPPALLFLLLSHHVRRLPVEQPETLSVSAKHRADAFAIAGQWPTQAAAFRRAAGTLRTGADSFAAAGFSVSPEFFQLQGVEPALGSIGGRADRCVVLSDRLWRSRFEAKREVIGRVVSLGGSRRTVCAVMPASYWFIQRSKLFWLLADEPAGANAEAFVLLRSGAELPGDIGPTIPLTEASRGALSAAWAVFLSALFLLAILGAAETVSLARTLGGCRSSTWLLARSYVFLFVKAVPALAVIAILWTFAIESPALAPVGYFAGVWSLVSCYLFGLLSTAVVWYVLVDQRARCPVCQRTLGMPVDLGVPGSILFDLPAVEYICTYGHGTLYLPEPTSEGVCEPAWRAQASWWSDLLGTSAPTGGAHG